MNYGKLSGFSDEISASIDEQFHVLKELNISYFEVRGVNGKNISELTEEEVLSLKEKMKQNGIKVSSIGSPIGKIKLEEDFEPHFELFKKVLQTAKMLEAKYIRMFSFYHNGGSVWTEDERTEVLSRLDKMIELAKEEDVILLHENEKDIYGDTADRCTDLFAELGGSHFKAVFDPANFIQSGENAKSAYEKLKSHIAYMHIKDAKMADDTVVPAGAGDGNVEYILKDLFDGGYDGFLSLEPHLGSFEGLQNLELDDKMQKLPKGGERTFKIAYYALEEIIKRIMN